MLLLKVCLKAPKTLARLLQYGQLASIPEFKLEGLELAKLNERSTVL